MRDPEREYVFEILFWFLNILYAVFHSVRARAEYQERPVTIIVGMDPFGPIDTYARALMSGAQRYLSKPIVIEKRDEGNGAVAMGVVAAARADGYMLCAAQS